MKTEFAPARLDDPRISEANAILRTCVHCGFCNSACPTYAVTGDERDGPRGRIWLMRDLLEGEGEPEPEAVFHLDRCIECLACMPACPSGVDYRHLLGIAREEIAARSRRPLADRVLRRILAGLLAVPRRLRVALALGRAVAVLAPILPARLAAPLRLARRSLAVSPPPAPAPAQSAPTPAAAQSAPPPLRDSGHGRVALLAGCVEGAMAPGIEAAFVRLLTRAGVEVVTLTEAGCCGAIDAHLGRAEQARARAKRVIAALERVIASGPVAAVVRTSSGCGAMLKEYAHLLAREPEWSVRARAIAALARDPAEVLFDMLGRRELAFRRDLPGLRLAWQAPCSLVNAQRVTLEPLQLLRATGLAVAEPADGGRCCGAGGVYSVLEPGLSEELAGRKGAALAALGADAVVSANLGCMVQVADRAGAPVVHLAEVLDWATGGPPPAALAHLVRGL